MNKDNINSNDAWEGKLASRFDEDIQFPPDKNWNDIEQELFPTKKRRFTALWIAVSIIFLGGMVLFFLQKSSISENEIKVKNATQNNEKRTKKPEKKSTKNPIQKVVLSEKNEHSIILKQESKVENLINQSPSIQNKQRRSNSSNNRTSNQINKSGKYSKDVIVEGKKHNDKTNPSKNTTLTSEVNDNRFEENTKLEKIDAQTTLLSNITSENFSANAKFPDTKINLKFLPIQLISISKKTIIKQTESKDKVDFKPYLSIQFSPLIGRNIRIVSGSFNSDNTNSNALGDRRSRLPKYGFQTNLNYHFNKRLSLNTGFQWAGGNFQSRWFFKYLQIDPTTNDIRLKTSSGEASTTDPTLIQSITNGTSGIYQLRINHAFSLYSIPVGISYRFTDQRISPYFRSGLNLEFFGRRSLSLDVMENGTARNIVLNLNRPNNRLNLQAILALGIETRIKNNWSFFTEAGYYIPLNQFVNANGYSVRIAGSSILGGIRYDLKK